MSNLALARPPHAPWEETPAGSPKPGKYGSEKSYVNVQGSAGEELHGICGMPGNCLGVSLQLRITLHACPLLPSRECVKRGAHIDWSME